MKLSEFCGLLALIVAVAACGDPGLRGPDAGAQLDAGVADASHVPTDLPPPIPNPNDLGPLHCTGGETFTAAYQAMLSGCGSAGGPQSCHGRAPFSGALDLTRAHAWAALVQVPASGAPAKLLVRPGDPNSSFLVEKLTNTQASDEGDPMPKGEAIMWQPPTADKLAAVRCWIARGAPND